MSPCWEFTYLINKIFLSSLCSAFLALPEAWLSQCSPLFLNKMLSQINCRLLWVLLKRAAMISHGTASSGGRNFSKKGNPGPDLSWHAPMYWPSPPRHHYFEKVRCEISSIVWILSFHIKRTHSQEMPLKIHFAGNSTSMFGSSFREEVNVRQTCVSWHATNLCIITFNRQFDYHRRVSIKGLVSCRWEAQFGLIYVHNTSATNACCS